MSRSSTDCPFDVSLPAVHQPAPPIEPSSGASVGALYIYPVKSCRGIRLNQADVTRRGFANDRRWMIVDDRGRFVTQRQVPELCRVHTALEHDAIVLTAAGAGSLRLPLVHEEGEECRVSVWRHDGEAVRHAEGSAWVTALVKRESSLVYMAERHERPVDPAWARPDDRVSFADGFPFLVISEASLAGLNRRLDAPLEMERFRPNIVVAGVDEFAEDLWREVAFGSIEFRAVKRCSRCVVTTIDPATGIKSKEPLRTLATYRRWDNQVWFGMNVIADGVGTLRVGDAISERGA
jgi:uncharacterized protein YcbX